MKKRLRAITDLLAMLFVHRTWKQVVLKNMFWASMAELVVRGLKVILIPLVARFFGPTTLGEFALAYSFATIFNVVFDAGLAVTATRELARSRENEAVVPDIVLMRFVLGAIGMLGLVVTMNWVTHSPAVRTMIVVLGAAFFVLALIDLSFAFYRARQRFEYEFFMRLVQTVLLLGAVAIVIWKWPSVLNVSYAYLVSSLVTLSLGAWITRHKRWRPTLQIRWSVWKQLLRIAVPLALAGSAASVYANLDSVLLGAFGRITETGWYSVATKVSAVLLVPTGLLTTVLFPAFVSTVANVDATFRRRWDGWGGAMIAVGLLTAWVVLGTAARFVDVVFGVAFHPAAACLQILALSVVLVYIYTPCYQALIMFDRQELLFWCLCGGLLVNVVLNLALIPHYGMYGSAWATVATHAVILVELFVLTARFTPVRPLTGAFVTSLVGSMCAGALAYVAIRWARGGLWVAWPVGILTYAVALLGARKSAAMIAAALFPSMRPS